MTVAQGTPKTDRKLVYFEGGFPVLNCTEVVDATFARQLERENAALSAQVAALDPEPVVCGCREALCPHTPVAKLPRQALVDHFKARIKSIEADRDVLSAQVVELQQRAEAAERKAAELQHVIENARAAHVEVYGRRFSGVGGKLFPDGPAED